MSNSVKITNLPIRKVSIGRPGVCSKLLCLIGILAKLLTTDIPEWSIVQIRGSYNLVLFHSNRNDDAIVIAQVSLHTTIALCSFEPLSLWSLILRFVKVLNKPKSEGSICFCHKRDVLKNTIATYRKMQKCKNAIDGILTLCHVKKLRNTTNLNPEYSHFMITFGATTRQRVKKSTKMKKMFSFMKSPTQTNCIH